VTDTPVFPRTQRIGILVFDGFEPIDVWGVIQPFAIARFIGTSYAKFPRAPFEVLLISNEMRQGAGGPAAPVKSWNGPRVAPDLFRDEALERARDEPFDVIMIPGGQGVMQCSRRTPPGMRCWTGFARWTRTQAS
jgi:putative intracellular protease/amidase